MDARPLRRRLFVTTLATSLLWPRASCALSQAVSLKAHTLELSLREAIHLGVRDNRTIRSAYLQRIAEKFDLCVAENQFAPQLVIRSRYLAERGDQDRLRDVEITPTATLLGELGTRLSLSWNNQYNLADQAGRRRYDGLTLSVIQPLLKGAGSDVTTAPVRLARLAEQANRLKLKATVAQQVSLIALAYRELLRAQEQLRIARHAGQRTQQLLEVNKALIAVGRMAEFDIVQTEAEVANQALAVEEASNRVQTSRLELLRLLALDLNTPIHANEAPQAQPIDMDHQQALRVAQEQQPDYLAQLIGAQRASINLLVARNQRLWDLSLIGGARQTRDSFMSDQYASQERNWQSYAGIQVDIPIGDPSARHNQVRAEVAVEDQALRIAEAQQVLERDVGNGVRDLGARWRQYEIAQRAEKLSLRKLEIERDKLQAGRSSNFQVLSYEADLRDAQNARLNALIAYLNTQTQLEQHLGVTLEQWEIALND